MDTIDITPTPLEYARIAERIIEGGYELGTSELTNYQIIWAWQAAEQAATRIGDPLHELPRRLAKELVRLYLARARHQPAQIITAETTYDDLKALAEGTKQTR